MARRAAERGAVLVDRLAHSLGTRLMQDYLSTPARAANVAHYVNIDGSQASAPPGGVPTLAIWGQGNPTRRIVGATNVRFLSQAHVEVATSAESFREMFRFFNGGDEPATVDVEPQTSGAVELAGRAVNFPANSGITGATLEVYEVRAHDRAWAGGRAAPHLPAAAGAQRPPGAPQLVAAGLGHRGAHRAQ
jgi:hypothetical protein